MSSRLRMPLSATITQPGGASWMSASHTRASTARVRRSAAVDADDVGTGVARQSEFPARMNLHQSRQAEVAGTADQVRERRQIEHRHNQQTASAPAARAS